MRKPPEKGASKRPRTGSRNGSARVSHRRVPRRLLWSALGAALVVSAVAGWLLLRHHAGETVAAEPMSVEERSLRDAARSRPADPGTRDALGAYLLEQRRPYEAMWAFQDALDLRPGDREACQGLARALVVARLPQQALSQLAACPAASPIQNPNAQRAPEIQNDVEERRIAAAAYLARGDAVGAVGVLSTAGPALKSSAPALLDLGNAEEAFGDGEAALGAYQRLVQLEPENVEGELALGRLAVKQRRWALALAALARARRAAPEDPRPLYELGVAAMARGGPEAAQEGPRSAAGLFQRVLQLRLDDGPAYLQLGLWYRRRGQPGAAALMLEKAVALHAGGEETQLRLAEALEAAGEKAQAAYQRGLYQEAVQRPDRALQEYQRLAALDPGRSDIPLLLSAVYTHLERKDRALQIARQGLARHPDDPQFLTRCAMLLMMTDNRAAAADLCHRWIQRQPQAAEPYRLLGRLERDALHPDAAIRLDEQAVARDPRSSDYRLELGLALVALPTPPHLRRAAAAFQRASALAPEASEPHRRLGEVLEQLGDREGALLQYQRSMDLDPQTRLGAYAISQLCPRLGKPARAAFYAQIVPVLSERADALQSLGRQVNQNPTDAGVHARLARLLLDIGDLRPASDQLEQAVALRPGQRSEQRQLEMLQRILALQEQG